jgi:hypothetical protein
MLVEVIRHIIFAHCTMRPLREPLILTNPITGKQCTMYSQDFFIKRLHKDLLKNVKLSSDTKIIKKRYA